MNKSIKKITAFIGLGLMLASCGGHATCAAYGYIKYDQEKQEIQKEINSVSHVENETI
ncbi:hypothetical protein [Brumimicrobium sp.]|uniref:hypothetical protein n=1 Tax=Brumimicrobium sp. TaxID=2029867 RepID=UPI00263227E7|nr:hypothetical protein [uncultured Brumimicrobium sp.]